MTIPYVDVLSGPQTPFFGIPFPSGQIPAGQPGSNLLAFLVGMRANFGFNSEPHTFELDFIPSGYGYGHGASGNLPAINTELELYISGFYIKGTITHSDWDSSDGGTLFNLILRDKRTILDQYKITTEDLGETVLSGIVSIPREYRLMYGLTQNQTRTWPARGVVKTEIESNDPNFLEYQKIIEMGATYPQIISAITNKFGSGISIKLPQTLEIVPNIGSDINSLRFKFNMQTFRSMLDDITLDTAFEWYWNMQQEQVDLINKKTPFSLPEDRILTIIDAFGGSGIENVKGIAYGLDKLTEATRIELMGARQEGIMNSRLLSPIDGLDTIYDGQPGSGTLLFEAAWSLLTVGFYDSNGYYRTYIPTEKELQMSLAGIEQWTYFKKYQTEPSPSGWSLPSDAGHIAAQHPNFQSRLDPRQPIAEILTNPDLNIRIINNRRDLDSNWVLEFFSRINQHAQRHYGKSYICTNALTRNNKVFTLTNEAWCNLENQRQDQTQPFVDDYEIDRRYGPIAPFFNGKTNKVSAFCVLPSGTVYGPLGEDSPASFISWTEDAPPFNPSGNGEHYIPISLNVVGQRVIDPRNEEQFSFENFPENTVWCQLPQIAASGIIQDDILGTLATLTELGLKLGQSGIIDIIDPRNIVVPYSFLSGVALPVISNERYGIVYPTGWASGTADVIRGTDIFIEEGLAPWEEFPEGSDTSIDKLNRRAFDVINSRRSVQQDSQFVNIRQVGLPRISFDTFARQTFNVSGLIGEREHGVNEVNINYGAGGLETTYKAQSYFTTARIPGPLAERTRARLEGIIQPIDFTELGDFLATLGPLNDPLNPTANQLGNNGIGLNFDFERQEACTVISIANIFNESACNRLMNGQEVPTEERYFAQIDRKEQFVYVTTGVTFEVGLNTFGHTLNSLDVTIVVAPDDNNISARNILSRELDQHSVIVQNDTGQAFTGTLMILNREGAVRPTQETIRNGFDVTEQGVVCNDGYLNIDDKCVYVHKRVDGEELAFLTGGRKFNAGTIITVEEANSDGSYNVSIFGDSHGRWVCNVNSLNSTPLSIGLQAPLEPSTSTSMRPGPNASGFLIISPTNGGGIPAQIMSLSNAGTSGAYATVQELDASGVLASRTYSPVYIIPYPAFAEIGDRGLMSIFTPTSGFNTSVKYIHISRTAFLKY